MPSHADTPTPSPAAQRKAAWGRWLDGTLTDRALRNRDLVQLLKQAGAHDEDGREKYGSGIVSQWRDGTAGPSETAALFIAEALGLYPPDVLRAAGHHDAAHLIEKRMPRTPAPADEARRRADTIKADIDELVRLAEIGRRIRTEREHAAQDDAADVL